MAGRHVIHTWFVKRLFSTYIWVARKPREF